MVQAPSSYSRCVGIKPYLSNAERKDEGLERRPTTGSEVMGPNPRSITNDTTSCATVSASGPETVLMPPKHPPNRWPMSYSDHTRCTAGEAPPWALSGPARGTKKVAYLPLAHSGRGA